MIIRLRDKPSGEFGQLSLRGKSRILVAVVVLIYLASCAPRVSRSPLPPPVSSVPSVPPPSLAAPSEPERVPIQPRVEEARIKKEETREKPVPAQPKVKDQRARSKPPQAAPPLPDDSSLIAKITPQTPARRAASLRLTEEGRKLLEAGQYKKALARLEKTIAIDSTNLYGYYYLAKVHYHLSRYQESLNFLDVAESLISKESYWLAEVLALKGENFRALGQRDQADSSYTRALRLNPGNRIAGEGLGILRGVQLPAR